MYFAPDLIVSLDRKIAGAHLVCHIILSRVFLVTAESRLLAYMRIAFAFAFAFGDDNQARPIRIKRWKPHHQSLTLMLLGQLANASCPRSEVSL